VKNFFLYERQRLYTERIHAWSQHIIADLWWPIPNG